MGVKIVTGADTGYGPGSTTRVGQEIANLVEIGLTPLEAIRCATTHAAEMLRLPQAIGAIEPGFEADLIAVDGNPLETVKVVQDPVLVVSNGRVALDRLSFAKRR
jgi:imidazolonepropionase-like amidohydrolase